MYYLIILLFDCILAIIPANIAKRKGKSFGIWYCYGLLIWIVAVLHAISLPETKHSKAENEFVELEKYEVKKFNLKSPLQILGYNISKDDDKTYIQIKLKSYSTELIKSLKFDVIGKNTFNELVSINEQPKFELIVPDIEIAFLENFCTEPLELPDNSIRIVELTLKQIKFINGDIENISQELVEPKYEYLSNRDYNRYAIKIDKDFICYPSQQDKYWICKCSCLNENQFDTCQGCHESKEKIFEKYSFENFEKLKKEYDKNEEKNINKKNKIIKNIGISLCILCIIILTLFAIYKNLIIPSDFYQYKLGNEKEKKGEYTEAIEIFLSLNNYKNSVEKSSEVTDEYIEYLETNNNLSEAIDFLKQKSNIPNQEEKLNSCYYELGNKYFSENKWEDSYNTYKLISTNYKDTEEKLKKSLENLNQELYQEAISTEKKSICAAIKIYDKISNDYKDVEAKKKIINKYINSVGEYKYKATTKIYKSGETYDSMENTVRIDFYILENNIYFRMSSDTTAYDGENCKMDGNVGKYSYKSGDATYIDTVTIKDSNNIELITDNGNWRRVTTFWK